MLAKGTEAKIVDYLYAKASYNGSPIGGTFELTPMCNMNCKMCYVHLDKKTQEERGKLLTTEQWLALGEEAYKNGLLFLLLTGGEPFLRSDFRQIYEGLYKYGLVMSINSNGTLIKEDIVEWLKQCPPARINITLYGASDETYGELCGNPQGYTQVTRAIRLLREAGIQVKLNCSLTPYNIHDLEKMIRFSEEHELILDIASYMFPPLRRSEELIGDNNRFTPDEAGYYSALAMRLQYGDENFLEMLRHADLTLRPDLDCIDVEGDKMSCRAGRSSFWIAWDGRMSGCGIMDRPSAYPLSQGFQNAWDKIRIETDKIRLPASCANCSMKENCSVCAAMVLTETGGFTERPLYRCQMAKSYILHSRKIKEELEERFHEK